MPVNFLFGQEMRVNGTDLTVRVERGLPLVGSDKLVVINNLGGLVRKITPFGRGKRIGGIYPFLISAEGYNTVGYETHNTGVVQVVTGRADPGIYYSRPNTLKTAYYDLSTGRRTTGGI